MSRRDRARQSSSGRRSRRGRQRLRQALTAASTREARHEHGSHGVDVALPRDERPGRPPAVLEGDVGVLFDEKDGRSLLVDLLDGLDGSCASANDANSFSINCSCIRGPARRMERGALEVVYAGYRR